MEDDVFNRTVAELLLRFQCGGVSVQLENRFPEDRLVGGKYHMPSHTVYLYKEEIKQQCLALFGSLNQLEDYIAVILAHELGHSADKELARLAEILDLPITRKARAKIRLRIEENAWKYAESLLSDIDPAFLGHIVDESLLSYRHDISA